MSGPGESPRPGYTRHPRWEEELVSTPDGHLPHEQRAAAERATTELGNQPDQPSPIVRLADMLIQTLGEDPTVASIE